SALRSRTGGRGSGTTPTPNPFLVNPALAKELSIYSPEEIRAAIAHLEAQLPQARRSTCRSRAIRAKKRTRWTLPGAPRQKPGSSRRTRASQMMIVSQLLRSGRPGSNRRRPAWEAARLLRQIAILATNNEFESDDSVPCPVTSDDSDRRGHSWAPRPRPNV